MSQRDEPVETLPQASNASRLSVPDEIELRSEWVCWQWTEHMGAALGTEVEPTGLLERFVGISDSHGVLEFARQYGPLGLCEHGEPLSHAEVSGGGILGGVSVVFPPRDELFYCPPAHLHDGWFGERVEWWLTLASAMRAVNDTVLRLRSAERPKHADLAKIHKYFVHETSSNPQIEEPILPGIFATPDGEGRIDAARARAWTLVLGQVNKWLQACPTCLHFTFTDAGTRRVDLSMSFTVGDQRGCFPALVFELVSQIRGGQGHLINVACAHCGDEFVPRNEPLPGQRAFCRPCRREGWPMKYALRTQYRKKKRTRELRAQGKSISAIASELGFSQARVRRYLAGRQ